MGTPKLANEFLTLVEKSGLLSASRLEKAVGELRIDESTPSDSIARRLVRARLLTPFQAERLLEGRYRGFVIDNRYFIREVLGIGGMGCLYIAEDREIGEKVALKVLASQHALDAGMLTRMKLEAHAGMQLKHPNIVRTRRMESTGALTYMVMDLVRGISLHELIALHGAVKPTMAADMMRQAAKALHDAHRHRIIHRDIKPANFLIENDGKTWLLDFGLALLKGESETEFALAMIFGHDCLGTPDFIAPEQIKGSSDVDARADIYGLGATFYLTLTAKLPFPKKTNSAKLRAHQTEVPIPLRKHNPKVPEELAAIVAKMMARDPDDRYSSMAEVAAALKPFARREKIGFDFRELVTLRAKQARKRAQAAGVQTTRGSESSITSPSGWLGASSRHLQAEVDTFTTGAAATEPKLVLPPVPEVTAKPAVNVPKPLSRRVRKVTGTWYLKQVGSQRRYTIRESPFIVGSQHDCDLNLPADIVENEHCRLNFENERWSLHPVSRSHPTFVNGKPMTHGTLSHGDRFRFGESDEYELLSHETLLRIRRRRIRGLIIAGVAVSLAVIAFLIANYVL